MWNILGDGPLKQPEEPDAEVLSLLFGGGDDVDEGPLAWQERALCAQTDPEAFFPEKGGSTREAKRVCATCEVREECLEYALANDERFGIWGGMSEPAAIFIGSLVASLLAQLAAREMKLIASIFANLAIVAFVPGLGLYRCMSLMAQGNTAQGLQTGTAAMVSIVMISLGLAIGSFLFRVCFKKRK